MTSEGNVASLGTRSLDIVSSQISKQNTLNLSNVVLTTLRINEGIITCVIGNLTEEQSNLLSNDYSLQSVPKLGRHCNEPLWSAKLAETLIKRHYVDNNMNADVKRHWDALHESFPEYAAVNEKLLSTYPQKGFFEIVLEIAKLIKSGSLYINRKLEAAKSLVSEMQNYLEIHEALNSCPEQIAVGDLNRERALQIASNASKKLTQVAGQLKTLIAIYPQGIELVGMKLLIGDSIQPIDLNTIVNYAQIGSNKIGLFCSRSLISRTTEPTLKTYFESDNRLLTMIQNLTSKQREALDKISKEKNALSSNVKEVIEQIELFTIDSTSAEVKAMKDRLDNALRLYGSIQLMDAEVETLSVSVKIKDGTNQTINNLNSSLNKYKIKLIELEDMINKKEKEIERNRKEARDALAHTLPKDEFQPFRGASDSLLWMHHYELKKVQFDAFPEMKESFVTQLKGSFKNSEDRDLIILYTTADQIREYVDQKYIQSGKVIDSCLSKLLALPPPVDHKKSISNINMLIKTLELFVKFKLESFIHDKLIDELTYKAFIKEHREEFHNSWATRLTSLKATPDNGLLQRINIDNFAMSSQMGIAMGNRINPIPEGNPENLEGGSVTNINIINGENFDKILQEKRDFFYFFLNLKYIYLTNFIHIKQNINHNEKKIRIQKEIQ